MHRPLATTTRRTAKISAAIGVMIAAVAISTVVTSASASAAEVPGAITDVSTKATEVWRGARVEFDCTWAVPDHSQPGDTFTLQLPAELQWEGPVSFPLYAPNGETVANAVASPDAGGLVTFTLTDYVLAHPLDVHGACHFVTEYTENVGGEKEIVFELGGKTVRFPVVVHAQCDDCQPYANEPVKYMNWHDDVAQNRLDSVILAPATQFDGSITVVDTPVAGIALDCSSVRFAAGPNGNNGIIDVPVDETLVASVDCSTTRLEVTWSNVPAGTYSAVWVDADTTEILPEYDNVGTVTMDGNEHAIGTYTKYTAAGGDGIGNNTTTTTTTPQTTVPETTVPETTTPEAATPETTVPVTATPETTVPVTTTPVGNLVIPPTTTQPPTTTGAPATSTTAFSPPAIAQSTFTPTIEASPVATNPANVSLPHTGTSSTMLAGIAVLMLGSGVALLLIVRRRPSRLAA